MEGYAAGLRGPTAGADWRATAALILIALAAGAAVSALGVFGTALQTAFVLLAGAGLPLMLLFFARPDLALACYLLVLPLATPGAIALGMNGGELLTAGVLLLGVLTLWQVASRIERGARSLRAVIWPLAGLAVVGLLSLIANGITAFGEIAQGLFKILAFAVMAVLVYVHASTEARAMLLLRAIVQGAILVAVYAVIAYVLGWSYSEEYDVNRARGMFEDYNDLGGFMVLTSATTLGLAATTRGATTRLLLVLACLVQIAAMLLSLTLGSLVALAAGGALALLVVVRIGWRRMFAAGAVFVVGVALVILSSAALREKLTQIDERMVDRLRTYAVGASMFRDKFLLGFGTQAEVVEALWYGEADYGLTALGASSSLPHNSLLLMGVEKGFLGVILFALLMVGVLRLLFRQRTVFRGTRHWLLYAGVMVSMLGFLIQNLANNLILHARVGIIFFAMVALVVRLAEFTGSSPDSRERAA